MSTTEGSSTAKEGSGFWKSLFQSSRNSSMTTDSMNEWDSEQVGDTAGLLWQFLHDNGPTGVEQVIDRMELPRDLLMQSIGWLAREGKLSVYSEASHQVVSLSE